MSGDSENWQAGKLNRPTINIWQLQAEAAMELALACSSNGFSKVKRFKSNNPLG